MEIKIVLALTAVLLCIQIPMVSASQIVIQDADSTWNATSAYSTDLENITSNVAPRVPVEYAKTLYHLPLISSSGLGDVISSLSARIVLEYANSNYRTDLYEISTELEGLTSQVSSRIVMEYATSNFERELIFPEELFNETPNQPPAASFTFTTQGLVATFTSTSNDSDDGIVSYHWDFGDGASSSETHPVHSYSASGTYTVRHTVKDSRGRTDSATKEVPISSIIKSVSCPASIAKGSPLRVEVRTDPSASITAAINGFSDTKSGKWVAFTIDTSGFTPGSHGLTITANSDTYQTSVRIFDTKSYQEVIYGLEDLEQTAEDEMHEISWMTGYAIAGTIYDFIWEQSMQALLNKLAGDGLSIITDESEPQLLKFNLILQENGLDQNSAQNFMNLIGDVNELLKGDIAKYLGNIIATLGDVLSGVNGKGEILNVATSKIVEPAVYDSLCTEQEDAIKERTITTENDISTHYYTDDDVRRMKEILTIGREAIRNTDSETIYRLHIGTIPIVNKEIKAEPNMYYFKDKHESSLNPPSRWHVILASKWVIDMTLADAQSILTLPAKLGWIEVTPENEKIEAANEGKPLGFFIPLIVGAVKAYIAVVEFVETVSPSIISCWGMFVSTDLLANEINEEHADTITAMLSVAGVTMESTNPPELVGDILMIPQGDIIVTITPDGRIVDIEYIEADLGIKPPVEYTIVSLNAGKSFKIAAENPNISLQLTPNKENYLLTQTAYITVNVSNNMNEPVNDTLLWFVVPSENLTIKNSLNLSAHSVTTLTYNFTVSNESIHVPIAFLTIFDEILAEGYCSFTVGSGVQEGAVMTVDHNEYYDPGMITMNVTVENVGNVEISPVLLYDGSVSFLTALQPEETVTEIATFNYTEPGIYSSSFILGDSNGTLDVQSIEFTVRAIDTLLAFPTTDKYLYNYNDTVSVSVSIKNATLHPVSIPYELEIVTPSGDVLNESTLIAREDGTYLVKATPIASGYATVSGDTLFIVERQSDLKMAVSRSDNAVLVYIKTDAGGAVEDVSVILNGIKKATDSNGIARFEFVNATEVFVKAEKFGFNPAVKTVNLPAEGLMFDTGLPLTPYPSISGVHNGTITLNQSIIVSQLTTYPCAGAGGHAEYVRIFGNEIDESSSWKGYVGDWHTITFDDSFILEENETYNYTIQTGSYPQIHHNKTLQTENGWINCTEFTDVNGNVYDNWIPAMRLF